MKKITFLTAVIIAGTTLNAQNFQEVTGTPFNNVDYGDIAFADVNGDSHLDVLIVGSVNFTTRIAKLYLNDGNGNYTEKIGTPFDGVKYGTVSFFDTDGDNDVDVLITGEKSTNVSIAKLYLNDGNGNYTEKTGTPFSGAMYSAVGVADMDGDNDMDIVISGVGYTSTFAGNTEVFFNDGAGNYTKQTGPGWFSGVGKGSISFADVDGDNDIDILITGRDFSTVITRLYLNNGTGTYTLSTTSFNGVGESSSAFADVDGDNDMDLIITGMDFFNTKITELYLNDGTGLFTKKTGTPFDGISSGDIAFADVDNDNDMDLLLTGGAGSGNITKLFINDGLGVYTEVIGTNFAGLTNSNIAVADIDSDSKIDFIICGNNSVNYTKLYKNITCSPVTSTDTRTECSPFVWIDGNTYTANNTTAKDTIIAGAANGCDSIVTLDLTITTVDTSVTQTGTDLTANEMVATYQWLDCNNSYAIIPGATFRTYYVTSNGSYAVAVTYYGCTDTSSCYNVIVSGINENTTANNITIYPNPVKDQLSITAKNEKINSVNIISVTGKTVKTITQNTTTINVADLTKGFYLLQIQTDKGIATKRFIKE